MNYYELIQRALDYIENHLTESIVLEELAKESKMSLTNLYRLFYSLTGYTMKDYIRRRRISYASMLLTNTKQRILDIALECQFESQEAFSRAFKQLSGSTPKACRNHTVSAFYLFERIDIMDTYFENQEQALLLKYPDIKVLKKLEPVRVAYYQAYSKTPEFDAFQVLRNWAEKNNLLTGNEKSRIFGFDTPDSKPGEEVYGYEVWMTIDQNFVVSDEKIKTKVFEGGMYAVTSTTIKDIVKTWSRFKEWLKISPYGLGTHQWLEEHLALDKWEAEVPREEDKIDLYMPIKEKEDKIPEEL